MLLLEDIERSAYYDRHLKGEYGGRYVKIFTCSSDGTKSQSKPSTSYVANGGLAGPARNETIANGPFLNRIADKNATVGGGAFHDGREYTITYSENVDATLYTSIGWCGFNGNSDCTIETEACVDNEFLDDLQDLKWGPLFLWHDTTPPPYGARINQGLDEKFENDETKNFLDVKRFFTFLDREVALDFVRKARPSSYHPGGVNVAFVSGRVVFLREDIEYLTYIALMTTNDNRSDIPTDENGNDYLLEDGHYL